MQRRYDLDWLRVLAFAVLIFYHIGMLYVADWGFHYKSQYQSEFLQNLMLLVNRWRLPLLFFISGVASHYLLHKYSLFKFAKTRTWRLLLPLLFGVLVIVPPQLYIEMTANADLRINYWDFYRSFFDLHHPMFADYQSGILPHIDVNHLWYLRELWWFSIILMLVHPLINYLNVPKFLDLIATKLGYFGVLLLPVMCLSLLAITVFPDSNEGIRIARSFCFFILGYLIWHTQSWWTLINTYRLFSLVLSVGSYIALLFYYHLVWTQRSEILSGLSAALESSLLLANRWVWLLAILGYANAYLNKSNNLLGYLSKAVYPSYLLHQSVLIVAAFCLAPLMLGGAMEAYWVIFITITLCFLVYECCKRVEFIGPLIGIKRMHNPYKPTLSVKVCTLICWLFILPFGLLILL
jgi:hypothetical protein